MTKKNSADRYAIGVDIGGTGIKAGVADIGAGKLAFKRVRMLTPKPSTPDSVMEVLGETLSQLHRKAADRGIVGSVAAAERLPIGVAFPGVMKGGVVSFTGNMGPHWPGFDLAAALHTLTGRDVPFLNDADAAGLAEVAYGAGRKWRRGTILVTTLGTGIGTALFTDGRLFPYSELGHIEVDGVDAERQAAQSAREREELSFPEWARRLQSYYTQIEHVLNPDYIIVGGGVSKQSDEFLPLITTHATMVPAALRNEAGIVGAALVAANGGKPKARVPKRLRS